MRKTCDRQTGGGGGGWGNERGKGWEGRVGGVIEREGKIKGEREGGSSEGSYGRDG